MFRYILLTVLGALCALVAPPNLCAQADSIVVDQSEAYALAIGHYRRKDWNRAVIGLGAVANNTSESDAIRADAQFFLGEAQVQLGQYDEAFQTFNTFVNRYKTHKQFTRACFRRAEAAFFSNDTENAIVGFKTFASRYKSNPLLEYALPYLGELYLAAGDIEKSQQAYQDALNRFPNSPLSSKCRFGLAKSYRQSGDAKNAARFYTFVADQGNSVENHEARLQLGTLWFESKEYDKSRTELLKVATERTERNIQVQAIYWLARCEMELGNWNTAVGKLRSIASPEINEPLGSAIYYDGAVCALKIQERDTALELLDELNEHFPQSKWADDSLELSITIQTELKNWNQVKKSSQDFLDTFPKSPYRSRVQAHLGRSHYEAGNNDKALEIFSQLVDSKETTQSESIVYWQYWKSICEIELKRFDDAATTLESIEASQTSAVLLPYILLAKATTYQATKNWQPAHDALSGFLEISSSHAEAQQCRIELAVVSARLNQWSQAKQNWDLWVKSQPSIDKKIQAAELLGELAYQAQKYDLSRSWFTVLVEQGDSDEIVARGQTQLTWLDAAQNKTDSSITEIDWSKIEKNDSSLDALLAKAASFETVQKNDEAKSVYQQIIERFSEAKQSSVAKFKLAKIFLAANKSADQQSGIKLLQSLLNDAKAADFRDKVLYELAWVYKQDNQLDEAKRTYECIAEEFPDSEYWADSMFRMAKICFDANQYDEAKKFVDLLQENPGKDDNRQLTFMLKFDIAIAQSDMESAGKIVDNLASNFPESENVAKLHFALGECLFTKNLPTPALSSFKKYLKHPSASGFKVPLGKLRVAQCYGYQDKWEKAAKLSAQALSEHSRFANNYEHYLIIGRHYASIAEFDEARNQYERVIKSYHGKNTRSAAMAQWLIGETYFHQKKYTEAIEAYYRVDSLYDYPNWRAASLLQAGKCHERLEQWHHSKRLYQQVVDEHPQTEYANEASQRLEIMNRRTTQDPRNIR